MTDNSQGNVYELFRQRSISGECFIRLPDGTDAYSYADLDRKSGQYAARFANLGLVPGERVIVQVEKSAECLFIYFGCLRAGLIYLPLNSAYQPAELAYFVTDAEPALIVCDPSSRELFEALTESPVLTLDDTGVGTVNHAPDEHELPVVHRDDDDIAVILYTSGTTGQPKGAMITHRNLATNGLALIDAWQWQKGDIMLHSLPIFHIHVLFVATNVAVLNASPIIFLPRFDAAEIVRLLPHATVYMGVPTNYTRLLAHQGFGEACCRNMRLFTSGSAPLLTQTFREFVERTGHTIVHR
jgi:malonyl-CoA/methylmalonyl-CoA synthetase